MDQSQQEFEALKRRVRDGCPEAVRELLDRYGPDILHVVRRRLHRKLRTQFDSVDFVQGVWASFFAMPRDAFQQFDTPQALQTYLAEMASHKVIDAFRQRFRTMKNNANGERSLDGSVAGQAHALPARQPTPSQVASAREEWDRLLQGKPAHQQKILLLLRQGKTHEEIARELAVNERTVRRLLDRMRKTLARRRAERAAGPGVLGTPSGRPPVPAPSSPSEAGR
jgi:RNA polymerase sigma factor (sigma-70 family)